MSNGKDAGGGALIFLFGMLTAYLSSRMEIGTLRAAGPGLFPLWLGILLMALSGTYTIGIVLRSRRENRTEPESPEVSTSNRPVVFFLAAMASAVVLLGVGGYAVTAFVLVLALLQILGMKRWRSNILIALLAGGVSYFLFVRWLKIPFPKGWLGL